MRTRALVPTCPDWFVSDTPGARPVRSSLTVWRLASLTMLSVLRRVAELPRARRSVAPAVPVTMISSRLMAV